MKKTVLLLCISLMLTGCIAERPTGLIEPSGEDAAADDWCSAYGEWLYKCINDEKNDFTENSAFSLYDINNDSIPELFISEDYCHAAGCRIYTYDKYVGHLGEYGSNGVVYFHPDTNYIYSGYTGQGVTNSSYYRLENGDLKECASFYDNKGSLQKTGYRINDNAVTKEEYEQAHKEYMGGYKKELGRDFPLTESFADAALMPCSDWKEAYTKLLYSLSETEFITQGGGFSVYDITGDSIPELFIARDSVRASQCYIYTFDNTVKALGEYGSYGNVVYSPKSNLMNTYDLHQGYEYTTYYRLGKYDLFEKEISFFNNLGGAETEADVQYTINGTDVSDKEYQSTLEAYKDENSLPLGLDYKVSKEDIDKAFEEYVNNK
ncbi:MAG: hypothetical protein E7508_00550 [Ruminococcus sp.]|nr:hypothetical protein [Ruminococcus sp.]